MVFKVEFFIFTWNVKVWIVNDSFELKHFYGYLETELIEVELESVSKLSIFFLLINWEISTFLCKLNQNLSFHQHNQSKAWSTEWDFLTKLFVCFVDFLYSFFMRWHHRQIKVHFLDVKIFLRGGCINKWLALSYLFTNNKRNLKQNCFK